MSDEIKAIVGVCREDNPADVLEAYGLQTFNLLYPDCEFCGMKFAHPDDCPVEIRRRAAELVKAIVQLEAAWNADNKLRTVGTYTEGEWAARQELAACIGRVSARAEYFSDLSTSPAIEGRG